MNRKIVFAIFVLVFTIPLAIEIKIDVKADPQIRRFRLLAAEQMFDGYRMKSAQFLIKELLNYPNWNNSTDQYVSHIHLLSMYNYTEVDNAVRDYWHAGLSKENIKNEIINFLGQALPGEIVIFYYNGHSHGWPPRFLGISSIELNSWLKSGGLPQVYVTLILDTCYSGYWTTVLPNCNVLAACTMWQMAWGGDCGVFTDGLIQGFSMANETNGDGWLSAREVFVYARNFTEFFIPDQTPTSYYGAVEGDIPLVHSDFTRAFPLWDIAVTSVEATPEEVESGMLVSIVVTVENQGEKKAIFNVIVFNNSSFIATQKVILNPEENATLTFTWDTTGMDGTLRISAKAGISPGEVDTVDNTYVNGFVGIIRPPIITVISPQNTTYSTSSVPLTFSVSEPTSWIGYSLDAQENVTITHNTTLNGLFDGLHWITVYANDSLPPAGNMGSSDTIYFTVDTTPPMVSILSPENGTWHRGIHVALNFTVSEPAYWIGYSFDGEEYVTISGNVTLSLPYGHHNITIYAEDAYGNMDSDIVYFTVTFAGDINLDGKADMKDVGIALVAYGSFLGHPRWNLWADINLDNIVNMKDIGIICLDFGKTI